MRWISQIDSTGYCLALTLPGECLDDCSASGDVLESVKYWSKRLAWYAPAEGTRAFLKASGAWEDEDLEDHDTNLERLLWIVCCDEAEKYA